MLIKFLKKIINIKIILLFLILFVLLLPFGGTWSYIHDIRWLYVFLLSFLISFLLNYILIIFANHYNIFDNTDNRKMHILPTPRLGGIAIFFAITISVFRNFVLPEKLIGLIIASTLIFFLGLLDDLYELSALLKLFIQFVAIIILIYFNMYLTVFPKTFQFYKFFNYFITVFWMIGLMNAINFMDGLDGLASGLLLISSLTMFIYIYKIDFISSYILVAMIGAIIGFLFYNFRILNKKDAKIFLGDSGSTFLGFLIAGIAVMMAWSHNNSLVSISAPIIILSIPIFDMIYISISRFKNGSVKNIKELIIYVGKDHLHHRLINIGFDKFSAVLFIFFLQICLSLIALVIKRSDTFEILISLLLTFFLFIVVIILMLVGRQISVSK